MNKFEQQIVSFVRKSMSDDQILNLVRAQLGAPTADHPIRVHEGPPQAGDKRRSGLGKKKVATKKSRRSRKTVKMAAEALSDRVLAFVLSSEGVAVKDVSEGLKITKNQASTALRRLRDEKKIAQGGERRFARYAKTKKIALAASKQARGL